MYRRYALVLYNYAIQSWHMDEDAAWEIIYKLLFKVTENINKYVFKNEVQFRNMVYTSFNRELINFYHKTKRVEERMKLLSFDESWMEGSPEDFKQSEEQEINEKIITSAINDFWEEPKKDNPILILLENILDELQDWERILVVQRSNGFSYREIAVYINKSEEQLKVYYSRIKAKIQKKLMESIKDIPHE